MKKNIYLLAALLLVTLTGCKKPIESASPLPQPSGEDDVVVEIVNEGDGTDPRNYDDVFSLTDEEKKLYDKYIESGDINLFKDTTQITTAKIFAQCGLDMNWEREFDLYAKEGMPITKEAYGEQVMKEPLADKERLFKIDDMFCYADKGEFIATDENHGYIKLIDRTLFEFKFYMVKEDGIWLVRVNPTRPDELRAK